MAVYFIFIFFTTVLDCSAQTDKLTIKTGAERFDVYLPEIKDKKIGLVVNNTSIVEQEHLVDFLLRQKIDIVRIFAPEHGYRGEAAAGEKIDDGNDQTTGIQVISLYGELRKPTPEQLIGLDVVVFDIQDVGCRFYTYISTLHFVIEACAENNIPLIILDRPNPNGDYVAGPVLKPEFRSFVGMDPIPVVHGCTVGELARMINGELWTKALTKCNLTVIPVLNYTHLTSYRLPVKPSPNLPDYLSVRLYPSLCFFEATSISVGRGTEFPFQVLGGLNPEFGNFQFTPFDMPGIVMNPLHEGQTCFGIDLRNLTEIPIFTLKFFLDFYRKFEKIEYFVTNENWLNLLAGTDEILKQIKDGKTEHEIEQSWQPELTRYKNIRKKYLLYPDFE
ncbi:MAG: DUF1343 domain-containing protein [Bacteroidales bacterium]|nr:DUF1343 domain-containing protein [Bacteroidales bacterium]